MTDEERALRQAVQCDQAWYDSIGAQVTPGVSEMLLERRVSSHFNAPLTEQEKQDRGTAEVFRLASEALSRSKAALHRYLRERVRLQALDLLPSEPVDLNAERVRVQGRRPSPAA